MSRAIAEAENLPASGTVGDAAIHLAQSHNPVVTRYLAQVLCGAQATSFVVARTHVCDKHTSSGRVVKP